VTTPSWVMLFSGCKSKIREIILDHFFIQGPIVFLKTMIILIRQSKKEILKANDYMSISHHMNHMLDSDAIDPLEFEKELWGFY
jgi:hypothetical protein